jgi:hypothetical protein
VPFEIGWHQADRIVHLRFYGDVTIDEIRDSSLSVKTHVEQGKPLVHTISDLSDVQHFPRNLLQISKATTKLDNSVLGWTIVIGANPILAFIVTTISQLAGARLRMLPTMEEALTFLKSVDTTLQDESVIR